MTTATDRFRALHAEGCFVIPNPFDRGSARLLASLGFPALATTSAGLAASLGRQDMTITRDQLLTHVADLAEVVELPVHVDSERGFADDPAGVAETVRLLAEAGAAGCSIEDWNPATGAIDPLEDSVARLDAAVGAAADTGLVLTARCEHLLHGLPDLDDVLTRLLAYRDAGAEVLYAPLLHDAGDVARVVGELGPSVTVNVLLLPGGLHVAALAELGVRRISLGSQLTYAAYGAFADQAVAVRDTGTIDPSLPRLGGPAAEAAFGD